MCTSKVPLILGTIVLTAISETLAEYHGIQKRHILNPFFDATKDTVFYLFTPNNKDAPQVIKLNDSLSLSSSKFNKTNPTSSFYLIGHSFGAHLAGYTGKSMKSSFNKTISTIFGLDPALPGYNMDDPNDRLNSTDAGYVEVIHSTCGELGFLIPVGQADFYPNWGGPIQPGCNLLDMGCSHERSFEFLAESINPYKEFIGHKCSNYKEITRPFLKTCTKSGDDALMGGEPSRPGRIGVFYLPTNSRSPFGFGQFPYNT